MRKREEDHENLERWLVSYADFITLMFAFFVVLYSSDKSDPMQQALAGNIANAFNSFMTVSSQGYQVQSSATPPIMVSPKLARESAAAAKQRGGFGGAERGKMKAAQEELESVFKQEASQGGLEVKETDRGVELTVAASVAFNSGSAELTADAQRILQQVSEKLKNSDLRLMVEGHTDNQPIRSGTFGSNWELSTARATVVAKRLIAQGINPSRIAVAGYADNKPLAPNSTAEGRSANRRITILLQPSTPTPEVPARTPPAFLVTPQQNESASTFKERIAGNVIVR